MCDSVNHTRFPKEDHLPDWARRDNKVRKGDRVKYIYIYIYIRVCVTLLTSSSILFQPFNHPQSCPTKRNTRKSQLYYFICPVTSLLQTALRLRSSRMLHRVVGKWVPITRLTPSLPHWRWRQEASADMVPIYPSTKCHITEDHTLHIHKRNHFKSHIVAECDHTVGFAILTVCKVCHNL